MKKRYYSGTILNINVVIFVVYSSINIFLELKDFLLEVKESGSVIEDVSYSIFKFSITTNTDTFMVYNIPAIIVLIWFVVGIIITLIEFIRGKMEARMGES